jgi:hypothetical protein
LSDLGEGGAPVGVGRRDSRRFSGTNFGPQVGHARKLSVQTEGWRPMLGVVSGAVVGDALGAMGKVSFGDIEEGDSSERLVRP